ncbi:hypothetical protein HUJ04_008033 [Dendroctonus ponderosae]|nr:hypothetical protein HUJ04_008033 [Dendroctonus ponderosae]
MLFGPLIRLLSGLLCAAEIHLSPVFSNIRELPNSNISVSHEYDQAELNRVFDVHDSKAEAWNLESKDDCEDMRYYNQLLTLLTLSKL